MTGPGRPPPRRGKVLLEACIAGALLALAWLGLLLSLVEGGSP